MAKVRQDAWSHEDDLLLAETVLRHVREGSTQLKAFEEVGDRLNRTSAACGFRWNAEVRKRYVQAMELAKRQRKERKRALARQQKHATKETTSNLPHSSTKLTTEHSTLSLETVIQFLTNFKQDYETKEQNFQTNEQLMEENKRLQQEISHLTEQLDKNKKHLKSFQEDYQTFIQIMDRARKMTVFEDQGTLKSPAFRMDKNGNL